ncbi:hypothetical protein [Nocardioides mangrovi]|uniref:Uncharacterized protein n=1 Tax=Nocardioides mangrovi TaxID=2874580 RepID=A0ABS7UFJ7_9ACTN|nr:hypothetical protein [Nocardioides mangrovi]MBZ5739765.1 hypothetical protein [Nocardioides mangrovi]
MPNGPIEFLGEEPLHYTPPAEYGGADGLIQPPPHPMTPSEANAAIVRAGMYGDLLDDGIVTDPATGRIVPPELNAPGGA